jgi:hypothetical protein
LPARVVDQQVDAAMPAKHVIHECLHLILLADVAHPRLAAAALGDRNRLLERLEPAPAHHHPRPHGRQLEGRRPPETGAAAADDRHLPIEETRHEELGGHGRRRLPC